jgi:hypothetical protein
LFCHIYHEIARVDAVIVKHQWFRQGGLLDCHSFVDIVKKNQKKNRKAVINGRAVS